MDGDGSAFIIHEKPDDHVSQPNGGAGARIACGIIMRLQRTDYTAGESHPSA